MRLADPAVFDRASGTVRAPGKLVVLGEYAVLDGGPALVAAVTRGVLCRVCAGSGVSTPQDDRFVSQALAGAPAKHYAFEDWNPVLGLGGKPGFGGSAAATVAACLAAGRDPNDAFALHHQVSQGGSGVDVFASLHGGFRSFRLGQRAPTDSLVAPPMIAVWSGQSASTGPRVAQYRAWHGREGFVREMSALVTDFERDPVRSLAHGYQLLCSMAAASGIAYDLPAFRAIHTLAEQFGGAAKPSGAGGGDIAVAVFPEAGALVPFAAACTVAGHTPISLMP